MKAKVHGVQIEVQDFIVDENGERYVMVKPIDSVHKGSIVLANSVVLSIDE